MEELEDHVGGADCVYGGGRGRGGDGWQCGWLDVSEVVGCWTGAWAGIRDLC